MSESGSFYDHDQERFLLGAILLEPGRLASAADLRPGDLHEPKHAAIWKAMLAIHAEGETISPAGIVAHLGSEDRKLIDGGAYLPKLLALSPNHDDVPNFLRRIVDLAGKRALWTELQQTMTALRRGRYDDVEVSAVREAHIKRLQVRVRGPSVPETHKTVWTIAELRAATFPEPEWVIPGVLPVGLAFLAGRPKVGKSWMCLQFAHAVGAGGRCFEQPVRQGKVLYLALEDGERRLRRRAIEKHQIPDEAQITLVTAWPAFGKGGIAKLHDTILRRGYTLSIVDTLSRAAGIADQLDIGQMTDLMSALQRISILTKTTILVLDHHRKMLGGGINPVDDLLGATAKAAVADVLMGLYKEQGRRTATLAITGRDIEEKDLALRFDGASCTWQLQGQEDGVLKDTVASDVVAAIRTLEGRDKLATCTTVARFLEKDKGHVCRQLSDLIAKGIVAQGEKVGREVPYHLNK
jgi:hypothetical protein